MSEQATEMEVRVAAVIMRSFYEHMMQYNEGIGEEDSLVLARAAIRAMREPTKEMIEGAYGDHETDWGVGVVNQAGIYTAMIDAATAPIQESPATATASDLESPLPP